MTTNRSGRGAIAVAVAGGVLTIPLAHFVFRPFADWLVAQGLRGVPAKAVFMFVVFCALFSLLALSLAIVTRTVSVALRFWCVFTLFLMFGMASWVLVDRYAPVLLAGMPEEISFIAEFALILAGVVGVGALADRLGKRMGINLWGSKRGTA